MNSKRLATIAELIPNTELIVDVGSDHAQLSILLVNSNKAKKVINIEKNLKPFNTSKENTKQYKNIENIHSDGFEKFDPNIKIDFLTIAGMGSKLMVDIICKSRNKIDNIILCPNNNENLIREFAYKNFYKINKDITIKENDIFYPIIWLSKTKGIKPSFWKSKWYIGNKNLKKEDLLYKDFLEYKIANLKKIENLKKMNKEKYKEYKIYLKELKKWQ